MGGRSRRRRSGACSARRGSGRNSTTRRRSGKRSRKGPRAPGHAAWRGAGSDDGTPDRGGTRGGSPRSGGADPGETLFEEPVRAPRRPNRTAVRERRRGNETGWRLRGENGQAPGRLRRFYVGRDRHTGRGEGVVRGPRFGPPGGSSSHGGGRVLRHGPDRLRSGGRRG